jgi:hypothetical protein
MIRPRKLLLAMIFTFAAIGLSSATNTVYIAQSAQGGNTGADCADAVAASYFNSSSHWSSNPTGTLIGPGTTVHLCSTISTNLTFQGNGASGNPVVLDGTGATMNAYINVGTQYWTIQNSTWSTSYATNSGTQAIIQTQGGAAFGTIQNNHIDIMSSAQVVFFGAVTHDVTVQDNYMKVSTGSGGDGFDTDVIDTEGAYNIMVQGNYIGMNIGAGDQNCGGCHDDLSQVWASGGSSANAPYNWTFRYNYFAQESSPTKANNLSMLMMEAIGNGYWDIYSNVFQCSSGGSSGNGITFDGNTTGMNAHIYNNTVVENAGGCNNLFNLTGSGNFYLENNIIYSTDAGNAMTGGVSFASRSKNFWYGSNIPSCNGTNDVCGSNPMFKNFSANDFSLQAGSPAIGTGLNLGTSYSQYPVPETSWPNPTLATRPPSGSWDSGTFSASTASTVSAPTGLAALVQ